MSGRVGSITTAIIEDGLIFNMDAANRASFIPKSTTLTTFSTVTPNTSYYSGSIPPFTGSFNPMSFTNNNDNMYSSDNKGIWTFDGIDDCLISPYALTNNQLFYLPEATTVSCWFKIDTSISEAYKALVYKDRAAGINRSFGTFYRQDTHKIQTGIFDAGNIYQSVTSTSTVNDGNWHNMVMTCNGQNVTQYLDSVLQGTDTYSSGSQLGEDNFGIAHSGTDSSFKVIIGSSTMVGSSPMGGDIANVQIYSRALSSNEVLHNYNALKGRFS